MIAVKVQHQVFQKSINLAKKKHFNFKIVLDSMWPSSATSQDGLAEAIQLLSCRPSRVYTQQQPTMMPLGPPFIEEPHTSVN